MTIPSSPLSTEQILSAVSHLSLPELEEESITDAEYEELTRLTDRAEELHADRMAALVELAKCRGVSLAVLMDQLGIHFPEHV